MRELPKAFQSDDYRLVLVKPGEKGAFEKDWTTVGVHRWDEPIVRQHLDKGGNLGVQCGFRGLVVVDFDDEECEKEIVPRLPVTMTVRSAGKGRKHLYFRCNELRQGWRVDHPTKKDEEGKPLRIADVQGAGTQVLIPPSVNAKTGRQYELINDMEPISITEGELRAAFFIYRQAEKKRGKEAQRNLPDLMPVLRDAGVDLSRNPTKCLWHESKGGHCLSYDINKGLWFCFHCQKGGSVIDFVMENEKVDFKGACMKLGLNWTPSKEYKTTTKTNHREIIAEFITHQPLYFDEHLLFWGWDFAKHIWVRIDEVDILRELDKFCPLEDSTYAKTRFSLLEAARQEARGTKPKEPPVSWIQFKDKIYDIQTGESHTPSPAYFMQNMIPWKVGKTDQTPIMDDLIISWVGEKHLYSIKEILAYCTYREYAIHRIIAFNGVGRNGKSTCLNLIKRFLGIDNFTTCDFQALDRNTFESAALWKKLACLVGEAPARQVGTAAKIKALSGQDLAKVEIKQKMPFYHYNYAKLIISFNEIPMSGDQSLGYYSRWFIIDYDNQFPKNKDVLCRIPDSEMENLAKHSLTALKALLDRGEFLNETPLEDRQRVYEERADIIGQFIKTHCIPDPYGNIELMVLYVKLNEDLTKRGKGTYRSFDEFCKKVRKNYQIDRFRDYESKYDSGEGKKKQYLVGYRFNDELVTGQPGQPGQPISNKDIVLSKNTKLAVQAGQVVQSRPYVEEEIVGELSPPPKPTPPATLIRDKKILEGLPKIAYLLDFMDGAPTDKIQAYLRDEGLEVTMDELYRLLRKLAERGDIFEVKPDRWKRVD